MTTLLTVTAVVLAFIVGRLMGHRAGSRPNEERYNRGWIDGYEIGRRTARPDTPSKDSVMVDTTTSGSLANASFTPKKAPAKIRARTK